MSNAIKPLMIMAPAPGRWPALQDLVGHKGRPWLADIERRVLHGVLGSLDVYAVIPSGGQFLANACIDKFGDVGVLGHVFTRPEHRRRGYARQVMETVLGWFDMTGGQWLFLGTTAELDASLYAKFGFTPLRRVVWAPHDRLTMVRPGQRAQGDPLADVRGDVVVREVNRAHWPAMVTLLQYRAGPDPRVPLEETAVTAEVFTLDLIDHQERGACRLFGAFRGQRLVALGTVASDRPGERTYAVLVPHSGAPAELREALVRWAQTKGYGHVDFPMEGLAVEQAPAPVAAGRLGSDEGSGT